MPSIYTAPATTTIAAAPANIANAPTPLAIIAPIAAIAPTKPSSATPAIAIDSQLTFINSCRAFAVTYNAAETSTIAAAPANIFFTSNLLKAPPVLVTCASAPPGSLGTPPPPPPGSPGIPPPPPFRVDTKSISPRLASNAFFTIAIPATATPNPASKGPQASTILNNLSQNPLCSSAPSPSFVIAIVASPDADSVSAFGGAAIRCISAILIPNACDNASCSERRRLFKSLPCAASCDRSSSINAPVSPDSAISARREESKLNPIAPSSDVFSKKPSKSPIILSPI